MLLRAKIKIFMPFCQIRLNKLLTISQPPQKYHYFTHVILNSRSFFSSNFLPTPQQQTKHPSSQSPQPEKRIQDVCHAHQCLPFVDYYCIIYMNQEQVVAQEAEARRGKQAAMVAKRNRRKIVKSDSSETQRELYYPDLYEYKKLDLTIQKKRVIRGSWSLQQNKIYLQFLSKFKKDFISQEIRRKTVVFNRLSKELHKRTPDQCRSHHQKLQNRFNNDIDLIIGFVQSKIKRKDVSFQPEQPGKEEKEGLGTRTSENVEAEEGIAINMEYLMIW